MVTIEKAFLLQCQAPEERDRLFWGWVTEEGDGDSERKPRRNRVLFIYLRQDLSMRPTLASDLLASLLL